MAGNPIRQAFQCVMTTSIPATIFSPDDAVGFLNSAGSGFWNDVLGGALTIENFFTSHLTSSSVSSSLWIADNGKAAIQFTLNTVSDPATASGIQTDLLLAGAIAAIAIGAALILIPGGGWALDLVGAILAIAGGLSLLSVGVTEVLNNPTAQVIIYAVVGVVVVAAGVLVYSLATSPKARASARSAVEGGLQKVSRRLSA
jgi:hypothetical protein